MSKTVKFVISGLISFVFIYLAYNVFIKIKYGYSIELGDCKRNLFFFNDSIKINIDTNHCVSAIRDRDIFNTHIYKDDYLITIWEFKDLSKVDLKRTSINQNVDLFNVRFDSGETLNSGSNPEFNIKFGDLFKNAFKVDVNLDEFSKITKKIETPKYKGFYGTVNLMSFSNETGEHLVLIDYKSGKEPVMVLFYKSDTSFYAIIVESKKILNENIIQIFNLK
jgi:hypothetical protein